ncbi:MAG: ferric reductase-like transmembrane domain-containing protein [Candidatus Moranbacteria bacterium]|nr:ferric reductase-like transmembrane domain-containing protein [Candidatus Moranbacteria bacterium]
MSFPLRFAVIMKKQGPVLPMQLTFRTAWTSLFVLVFCFWYLWLTEPGTVPITTNKALADSAMILIGLSFALSGLCYFWNFVDTKIIYRKYLGLAGFAFGLAHGVMSLVFYLYWKPQGYETNPIFVIDHQWNLGIFLVSNIYALASGVVALLIFFMMALISNQYAIHELGGVWWRRLLRVGYLAYVFATLHFLIKNIPEWQAMLMSGESELPRLNFMIFLLVCTVICLRTALWWSLRKKAEQEKEPESL